MMSYENKYLLANDKALKLNKFQFLIAHQLFNFNRRQALCVFPKRGNIS